MYKGKYLKLGEYLSRQEASSITLSFEQIEDILGFKLPPSAYNRNPWWANEKEGTHVQAKSWMEAGWIKDKHVLGKKVTFRRISIG